MRPDSAFAMREDAPPPALRFVIESAAAVEFAAVPTVRFTLRIDGAGSSPIRSVALDTHIRIDAARRQYDPPTRQRLTDLFGAPEDWGRTSRSLLWARVVTQVPGFDGHTVASIDVACTYDFEVAVAKYFHSLPDGEVPLTFLFSGTIFYLDAGLLRAARIPWDTDVAFRMPVRVWKDVMEHYFPRSAWLRLDRDAFDRLYDYKVRHTLTTWDDVVAALLVSEKGGG